MVKGPSSTNGVVVEWTASVPRKTTAIHER